MPWLYPLQAFSFQSPQVQGNGVSLSLGQGRLRSAKIQCLVAWMLQGGDNPTAAPIMVADVSAQADARN